MTDLVFCLSNDEKWWPHLNRLINEGEWENVYAIVEKNNGEKFKPNRKIEFVIVDYTKPVSEVINEIAAKLKGRIAGFEIALNLVSGGGKEHMAILSAVLKLGVGIRLVAVTKDGVGEL